MPPERRSRSESATTERRSRSESATTELWQSLDPDELVRRLARWIDAAPGIVRVAVDGADELAAHLIDPLRGLGRPAVQVRADHFWRDASLRFEHGKTDTESLTTWLDADALRREVLLAVIERGEYLPSLRDPETNRSTREAPQGVPDGAVVLVSGDFLIGRELPFDRVIHVSRTPAKRAERTPPEQAWTLAAYDRYATETRPDVAADVVIKADRRYPAVRGLP